MHLPRLVIGKRIRQHLDAVTMTRRTIFFPLSWIIALTPLVVLVILAQLPRLARSWKTEPLRILYFSLFIFFLVFFIFESRDVRWPTSTVIPSP